MFFHTRQPDVEPPDIDAQLLVIDAQAMQVSCLHVVDAAIRQKYLQVVHVRVIFVHNPVVQVLKDACEVRRP